MSRLVRNGLRMASLIAFLPMTNLPAQASCNPFGCSQPGAGDCNPFGCPNPGAGPCTPFGCPPSPARPVERDRPTVIYAPVPGMVYGAPGYGRGNYGNRPSDDDARYQLLSRCADKVVEKQTYLNYNEALRRCKRDLGL